MALREIVRRLVVKETSFTKQSIRYSTATASVPQINPKIVFIPKKKSAEELEAEAAVEDEKNIEDYKPTRLDPPRIKYEYIEKAVPSMIQCFNYKDTSEVPKIEKVVVHYGIVDSSLQASAAEAGNMLPIVGKRAEETEVQKRKKKKANVSLKFRENVPISEPIQLRGKVMYNLLDRLISFGFSSNKDFKGLNRTNFDREGNCRIGVLESALFPEKEQEPGQKTRALDVYIHTTAKSNLEALKLLSLLGMPFSGTRWIKKKKKPKSTPKGPQRKTKK
eukprot:TRINITY_DN25943_c0_g1_i1.p1 TRINITY_DN25943_c0_g1~~TRINITY_DN25943_c0_g1_i1.p1  ORF type:complete len:277 (+),score=48.65 TRINITY_DN25943_c0_g1_i1:263-1093(+)